MLILRGNTDILRVVTGSAADIEPNLDVMQADNASPPVIAALPNFGPLASITTATTTTIVDATGLTSGHVYNVKRCSLYNNHASTSTTCRVERNDGTNTAVEANVTLLAGETLLLDENGNWTHIDSNGGLYPSVGNAASQAEMEAGTATDRYVTPQGVKWHPGVCKAWGLFTVAGATTAGYNVDAPTDNGTGDITMNITTDMSAAGAYTGQVTVEMTATTYAVANGRNAHVRLGGQAAGTLRCDCIDNTAITMLVKDPTVWHIAAFGDQA